MNKRRINEVIASIEASPQHFNMGSWMSGPNSRNKPLVDLAHDLTNHACGTVGCIAGWALALYPPKGNRALVRPSDAGNSLMIEMASDVLEIPREDGRALFMGETRVGGCRLQQAGPKQAVERLKDYMETENPYWPD